MAWTRLCSGVAEVTVYVGGKIAWTSAAQMRLSNPRIVQLFHDAEVGKLGIRKVGRCLNSLHVEPDDDQFYITAHEHLADAGIVVSQQFTETLQDPAPPVPPDDNGDSGIYWIPLP